MPDDLESLTAETPLERAARAEAETPGASDARDEQEADTLVADIDHYVAQNDPGSLPQAEAELNAWEIPTSPLDGVSTEGVLPDGEERAPLVAVFSGYSEAEVNIVRGLLEADGIAAVVREVATPSVGSIFSVSEGRWGDILVAPEQADAARAAIAAAVQPDPTAADETRLP